MDDSIAQVQGSSVSSKVRGATGFLIERLEKLFGLSEGYFLRLQNAYDTMEAKRRIAADVAKIKPYKPKKAGVGLSAARSLKT